jgi:hypothetical protein
MCLALQFNWSLNIDLYEDASEDAAGKEMINVIYKFMQTIRVYESV